MNNIPTIGSYIKDFNTESEALEAKQAELKNDKTTLKKALLITGLVLSILAIPTLVVGMVFSFTLIPPLAPLVFISLMFIGAPLVAISSAFFSSKLSSLTPPSKEINLFEYKRDREKAISELKNKSIQEIALIKEGDRYKYTLQDLVGFRLLDKNELSSSDKKIKNFYEDAVYAIYQVRERAEQSIRADKLRSAL